MSALAKPFVHSTTAVGGENTVNLEEVKTISVVDRPGIENQKDEFVIVFVIESNNNRFVEWVFADGATRDTAFADIQTLASNAI